ERRGFALLVSRRQLVEGRKRVGCCQSQCTEGGAAGQRLSMCAPSYCAVICPRQFRCARGATSPERYRRLPTAASAVCGSRALYKCRPPLRPRRILTRLLTVG